MGQVKEGLAVNLKIAFESEAVAIPRTGEITVQIHSIKKTPTEEGYARFDTEKNERHHADKFWAPARPGEGVSEHRVNGGNSVRKLHNTSMHASSDIRVVKCLDGLLYSFEILEHVYSGLHDACTRIKDDSAVFVPALWRCWSFIDVVHRIREIAQAVPGLSKKERKLLIFLEATKLAEEFRHYVQHLRSELSKKVVNPFPVWGSLSWVDPTDPAYAHTVLSGAQIKGTGYTGCVFDKVESKWVSKVCLGVAGKSFNFDPIHEACLRFRDFVIPWATSTYKPGIRAVTKPPIATMRLVIPKGPAPQMPVADQKSSS